MITATGIALMILGPFIASHSVSYQDRTEQVGEFLFNAGLGLALSGMVLWIAKVMP